MGNLRPDDPNPRRPRGPLPIGPKDLQRFPNVDVVNLLQILLERVERLEKDMQVVKKHLRLP